MLEIPTIHLYMWQKQIPVTSYHAMVGVRSNHHRISYMLQERTPATAIFLPIAHLAMVGVRSNHQSNSTCGRSKLLPRQLSFIDLIKHFIF